MSEHGTVSMYTNRACRCVECKAANAAVQAAFRSARRAERIDVAGVLVHPTARHGTTTAYNAYGCRCAACKTSHNTARWAVAR
ncbi:hypothetical protein CH305_03035 [Rhodococcus sp. 15-649-2-2]|nr:hypothetical protein CH305_03035 [Rhodococcus sp. 15-649-2-2]